LVIGSVTLCKALKEPRWYSVREMAISSTLPPPPPPPMGSSGASLSTPSTVDHATTTRESLASETPPSRAGYVMEKLAQHHVPQAAKCFARTFVYGEILAHAVSLSQHDMLDFAHLFLEYLVIEGMSWVVIDEVNGECVAFLLIDDYVAPSEAAIESGILERIEQATPVGLGLVFAFLEEMKVACLAKLEEVGQTPSRGETFHIIAVGADPISRGQGLTMKMVGRAYFECFEKGYTSAVMEATGFASQKLAREFTMSSDEDGRIIMTKPYATYNTPYGKIFAGVQVPECVLTYQRAAESQEGRNFQEAIFFLGSYKELVQQSSITTQLSLYAYFQQAVKGPAASPKNMAKRRPSRFQFVARSMYNAWSRLGDMSTEKARTQLTALVQKEWPDFKEILTSTSRIEKVGPPTLPPPTATSRASSGVSEEATGLAGRDSETASEALRDLRANTQRIMELKAAEQRSRLIWVPDQHANSCGRCDKPFGALLWRHHCRKCGSAVCNACSPFRAPLPRIGLKAPQRICFVCKAEDVWLDDGSKEADSGRMDDGTMHVVLKGSFSAGTVL